MRKPVTRCPKYPVYVELDRDNRELWDRVAATTTGGNLTEMLRQAVRLLAAKVGVEEN